MRLDHRRRRCPAATTRSNAMSRIRITLMTALVIALAAAAINSQAQPPPGGQRGGRGQRGGGPGGGPGGPGGWGGPGGPGGNLIALAGNEAVAKELKLTDRQKAKVKQISDDQNKKRDEVFQQFRQQADMAKAQAAQQAQAEALQTPQIDPSVDARGSGAGKCPGRGLEQPGLSAPGLRWAGPGGPDRSCPARAGSPAPGTASGQRRAGPELSDDARGDAAAPESIRKRAGQSSGQEPGEAAQGDPAPG